MTKLKQFAVKHPLLFGWMLILAYALLTALAYPVHYLLPETEIGLLFGDAASKLLPLAMFVLLLRQFGWLPASGLTRLGKGRDWLVYAGILIYLVLAQLYAFTGTLIPVLPTTPLTFTTAITTLPGAMIEEVLFRALVLVAMVLAWGGTKRGIVKSILLSSLFFGFMHLVNLLIRPVGVVLFQAAVVSLPGIMYGAMALKSRSLWPAILIHWLTNAAVNMNVTQIENYQESNTAWLLFALFLIPITFYSVYLIWKLPEAYEYDSIKETQSLEQPVSGLNLINP